MSKVLPSEWEAPDHLSLSEREFLTDRAELVNGIVAASYLQAGQVLLQVKRKFKSDPELNGWYKRWCDETLPFGYDKANNLVRIAEELESDPRIAKLVETCSYVNLYRVLILPGQFREEVVKQLLSGETVNQKQLQELSKQPEVELARAQALVEEIELTLIQLQLKKESAAMGSKERNYASTNEGKAKTRLAKAMQQLQDKQAAVDSLEKTRSTQELVLLQLQKQLKKSEVIIENMRLDPDQERKRSLARTVVDATRSLDMLLASIDRYSTDRPELGLQAIETIERKLEEVKQKLCECNAKT